jgi:Uma2 family endonuclease
LARSIEVLSDSTKATDFLIKLTDYQSVPDISTYLIFWQDEARVLVHRRLKQGWAAAEEIRGRASSIALDDVGVVIALEAIYGELLDAS